MRVAVAIGEIFAEVEDEQSYCPEVIGDLFARATHAAVTCFLALPDVVPAEDD